MEKAQVLIVEDDAIIAMDLESRMKQLGYGVCGVVGYGEQAIEKVKENTPDVVLMDIILKGEIDGIEAAKKIRTQCDIPVIFITGYADKDRLKRAKLAYPFGFIIKPFNDKDLEITIEMALYVAKVDSERKQTEISLQESEELHRITLGNISDAVFLTDDNGAFTFICPNVDVIFGYSEEEVRTLDNISKLLGDNYYDPNELEVLGEIRNIEIAIIDKAGKKHDLLVTVKGVSIKGGTKLITCRDITERKQVEETLRESAEQLRLVTDALPVLIAYVDSEQRYRLNNQAYQRWFGISQSEIKGKRIIDVIGDPAYQKIQAHVEKVLSGKEATFEAKVPFKDGGERYVNATYIPHKDEQGKVKGFFALVEDRTERKQIEE